MSHQLWIIFGWPAGIVVGNLLANLIWMVVHDWPQHSATRKHIEKHGTCPDPQAHIQGNAS